MSLDQENASGVPADHSESESQKDKVAYETYKKTLNEAKSAKEKNRELAAKLEQLEKTVSSFQMKEKEIEEKKLIEQGEYQKLVALREQELNEVKQKLAEKETIAMQASKHLEDAKKLQAFYDKLPGKIKRQEYLSFVDLDSIVVNPDTNRVDESSLTRVVSSFVNDYADLIDTKSNRYLPGNSPANSVLDYSPEAFKNKSLKDMKSSLREAVRARRQQLGV